MAKHRAELCMQAEPNVQIALNSWAESLREPPEVLGIGVPDHSRWTGLKLGDLISSARQFGSAPGLAPVQYVNRPIGNDQMLPCVDFALYLARPQDLPIAILVGTSQGYGRGSTVSLEVIAQARDPASRFLSDLRETTRRRNLYRDHVISLGLEQDEGIAVSFHRLPQIHRSAIILPPGVLERIERNAIQFSVQRERLQAARRHLALSNRGEPAALPTFAASPPDQG